MKKHNFSPGLALMLVALAILFIPMSGFAQDEGGDPPTAAESAVGTPLDAEQTVDATDDIQTEPTAGAPEVAAPDGEGSMPRVAFGSLLALVFGLVLAAAALWPPATHWRPADGRKLTQTYLDWRIDEYDRALRRVRMRAVPS